MFYDKQVPFSRNLSNNITLSNSRTIASEYVIYDLYKHKIHMPVTVNIGIF